MADRTLDWSTYAAVLFDLDGVITPTAEVHKRAWAQMFTDFLAAAHPEAAPYTDQDYFEYIDGKPRFDGVRAFLASRDITLPEGSEQDPATADTVRGLGLRKNQAFNDVLTRDGVEAYPGSVRLLDHLRDLGVTLGVVSSSANARMVLTSAGLLDRFGAVVDGVMAAEKQLPGKPNPDTFVHGADLLGAPVERSVVLEDAVSGVQAGAAGGFAEVIGVDRGAGSDALGSAGATMVVGDLAELVP